MPEPTDPFDRLGHLAPAVDADAATAAFRHRRAARARRRRTLAGGGVAAGLLVVAAAATVLASPDGDRQRVLAGSTTSPSATTVPRPTGLDQERRRTTTSEHGLTLTMDTPVAAPVGERMMVDITLVNDRPDPVTVGTVAPCHEPLAALAGSLEAVNAVEADDGFGAFSVDPAAGSGLDAEQWSGELAELPAVLEQGSEPKVHAGREEGQLATTSLACDAMLRAPEVLDPGDSIRRRVGIDLRWFGPESVDGDPIEVLASTGPLIGADGTRLDVLTARQPTTLVDLVDRAPAYEAALDADGVAAAPTLEDWLAETRDLPPGAEQRYSAAMTWWNGAWETWIRPTYGSGHQTDALRIRFDPETREVVDVRTVFWNGSPADEPAQPDPLVEPVDDVRYHVD